MDERLSARQHSGYASSPGREGRTGTNDRQRAKPAVTAIANAIRVGNYLLQRLS